MRSPEQFKSDIDALVTRCLIIKKEVIMPLTPTERDLALSRSVGVKVFAANIGLDGEQTFNYAQQIKELLDDLPWEAHKTMHLVEIFRHVGVGPHAEGLVAMGAAIGIIEATSESPDTDNPLYRLASSIGRGMPFLKYFPDREPKMFPPGTVIDLCEKLEPHKGPGLKDYKIKMTDPNDPQVEQDRWEISDEDTERIRIAMDKATNLGQPGVAERMNLPLVMVIPVEDAPLVSYGFGQNPYDKENELRPAMHRLLSTLRIGLKDDPAVDFAFYFSKAVVAPTMDGPREDVLQLSISLRSQEEPVHFVGQWEKDGTVAKFANGSTAEVHLLR